MPSRRRPKTPANTPSSRPATTGLTPQVGAGGHTDVERFAAALKDSEKAERAEKARRQQERTDAALRAEQAAAHASALSNARRDLERAVEAVRTAKQVGRGRAEADHAWKVSKALVIELETGTPPAWAPKPADPPEVDETHATQDSDEPGVSADAEDDIPT